MNATTLNPAGQYPAAQYRRPKPFLRAPIQNLRMLQKGQHRGLQMIREIIGSDTLALVSMLVMFLACLFI